MVVVVVLVVVVVVTASWISTSRRRRRRRCRRTSAGCVLPSSSEELQIHRASFCSSQLDLPTLPELAKSDFSSSESPIERLKRCATPCCTGCVTSGHGRRSGCRYRCLQACNLKGCTSLSRAGSLRGSACKGFWIGGLLSAVKEGKTIAIARGCPLVCPLSCWFPVQRAHATSCNQVADTRQDC